MSTSFSQLSLVTHSPCEMSEGSLPLSRIWRGRVSHSFHVSCLTAPIGMDRMDSWTYRFVDPETCQAL